MTNTNGENSLKGFLIIMIFAVSIGWGLWLYAFKLSGLTPIVIFFFSWLIAVTLLLQGAFVEQI